MLVPLPPKPPKTLAGHKYLMRIEDPAIRFIMQSIIAEHDKLRAQLNVLKANAQVTMFELGFAGAISPREPEVFFCLQISLPARREST